MNVFNAPAGTNPTVTTKSDGNGGMQIDVVLDAMLAKKMATPVSASNRILTDNLGVRQRLVRR